MARTKGKSRKKSSKQPIKAKNTYNSKAAESVYGPPKEASLKYNLRSRTVVEKPRTFVEEKKPKAAKNYANASSLKQPNIKKYKGSKKKQEIFSSKKNKKESSSSRAAQLLNNQKRKRKNAPRVNNSVRKFQLKLPQVFPNAPPAPWWNSSSQSSKATSGVDVRNINTKLLNTISVNADAIQQLNQELEAFGRYVGLRPHECEAREHLIHTVQQMTGTLFGIDPSDCQIFGSFAAKPVCTFESDVDLAIFGVVEPGSSEEEVDSEDDEEVPPKAAVAEALPKVHPNRKKQEKNRMKQEKVLKWKAVLDEMDQMQQQKQDEKDEKQQKKDPQQLKKPPRRTSPEKEEGKFEDEQPLFVIDRVGESEKDEESAVVTESSKETANDDANEEENSSQFADAVADRPNDDETTKDDDDDNDDSAQYADAAAEEEMIRQEEEKYDLADGQSSGAEHEENSGKDSESDEDNADKLEGLKARAQSAEVCVDADGDDHDRLRLLNLPDADDTHGVAFQDTVDGDDDEEEEEEEEMNFGGAVQDTADDDDNDDDDDDEEEEEEEIKKPRKNSIISLSSSTASTTCSDNEIWDESGMEVSFVTSPNQSGASRRSRASVIGPTGNTRTLVVRALNALSRKLRKSQLTTQLTVRKHARVPIINMETVFGYECDIALGGHNGTDTSAYASTQISRFQSFATVVLALKVILSQHGLDKPFTGGLGSFKLYVLVANHIERHLALGGSDNPAEVLFMFLFRYGDTPGFDNMVSPARTPLSQLMVIESEDGGSADMGGVFQVENCVKVFQACWRLLRNRLKQQVNPNHSILRFIVDANELQNKRKYCSQKASLIAKFGTSIPKHRLNYQNGAASNNLHATSSRNSIKQQNGQLEVMNGRAELDTDEEAEQIMAGYDVASTKPKEMSRTKRHANSKKAEKEDKQKRRKLDEQSKAKTPERFPPLGLLSEKSQAQKQSDVCNSQTTVVDPTQLTMCQVLRLPVEKLCLQTGQVLERFKTGDAAQRSASPSKNHRKFYRVLKGVHKSNSRVYCGYFWRLQGSDHVPSKAKRRQRRNGNLES